MFSNLEILLTTTNALIPDLTSIPLSKYPLLNPENSAISLSNYGLLSKFNIGYGATSIVRLSSTATTKYAVKIFKKDSNIKKIAAEFNVSSVFNHENISRTFNLVLNDGIYYQVMEHCNGKSLFDKIHNGMQLPEINQVYRQIINGLEYMHSIGVCHRDLKPENILFHNNVLKIIDFGVSFIFKLPLETKVSKCTGLCGSEPYIAPESYTLTPYDGPSVDIWASGIVYFAMIHKSLPWRRPLNTDPHYELFTTHSINWTQWDKFNDAKEIFKDIIQPNPDLRFSIQKIKASEWFLSISKHTLSIEALE